MDAKLVRRLLLGRSAETIKARCNMDVFQTDPLQIIDQLCLRQSAGDSARPQIDVAADVLGELVV